MEFQSIQLRRDFEEYFSQSAKVVSFNSDEEENEYEAKDYKFMEIIKAHCTEIIGGNHEKYIDHIDDWGPNHTRCIYVGTKVINKAFIESLQNLFKPPYESFRILVVVLQGTIRGMELGSFIIEKTKVVYEEHLELIIVEQTS